MQAAIDIRFNSTQPVHRQVYEAWRQGILNGRFAREARVPSTRELSKTLGVARSTVTQAYEQLIAEGYLQTRHGAGTFVCSVLPEKLLHADSSKKANGATAIELRLSEYGARLQDDYQYPRKTPGQISFAHWWPDHSLFPSAVWRRLMHRHLRSADAEIFNYARDPQGFEPLRQEIASYLARFRAVNCSADQVVIINGSQQALDLCSRLLLDAGDEISIENPGYLGARRVFLANGIKLKPVPVDAEGIDCSALGKKSRAVYVTPSHQFPMGVALSLPRRLELISWARQNNSVIIEDDYDSEYRYSGAPLPALQGLTPNAPVIYCGTFSKVLFPGLRVGYLVVPENLIAPFRRAKWLADRNTPVLEQAALADFLHGGHLERHIRRMRRLYAGRRQAMVESLARHFADGATVFGQAAGMHAYVRFVDRSIAERAERSKVQLRSAREYYLTGAPPNDFVFGFAATNERAIREGIKRLADG